MIIFFKSKKHKSVFYYKISGSVGERDAIEVENFFRKNYAHLKNVITVTHIMDDAVLIQKSFLSITAKANEKNSEIISEAFVLGLTEIRKFFYKTYQLLTPSPPVKVTILQEIELLEDRLNLNIERDFFEV